MKKTNTARVEHQDLGATGEAMRARPAFMDALEGKSRGTIATVRVEVVRYQDATLFDRMHQRAQLSDLQHEAAERLYGLFCGAGLNPRMAARIATVRDDVDPHEHGEAVEDDIDDATPLDRYRAVMRTRTPGHAALLESMMLEQHPGVKFLASLQAALSDLAKFWGMV